MTCYDRNVWGGCLLVILGGTLSVGKNKNRESDGALDFNGFCWMGGCSNQPKVGRNDWTYFLGDSAQGDDDRGGCCCIVWVIKLLDKNQ